MFRRTCGATNGRCVHARLRAVYRLPEKVMIPDKETRNREREKENKERVRAGEGGMEGWKREKEREGESVKQREGYARESRCICNFAVGRACVLCWRRTRTAECKMRKNRSLGKGDRMGTRSGKKLNPWDFIGARGRTLPTATVSFWRVDRKSVV